jgi:hypothetical protein
MAKVTYTTKRMVEVLRQYQENNYNLFKTSKETGVTRQTIRRWADTMGVEVFQSDKVAELVHQVNVEMVDRQTKFDNDAFGAKEELLKRIVKRIPKIKDIYSLARCLKIVHELSPGNAPKEPHLEATTFIQQMNNILNSRE